MNIIESATIVAPINNCTLYCKNPRILFHTNYSDADLVTAYITVKNNSGVFSYTSYKNPEMFSSISFNRNSNFAFIPQNIIEGKNTISIRLYDNKYFSSEETLTFYYENTNYSISEHEELQISADLYNNVLKLCNNTLKAYGKDIIDVSKPSKNTTKVLNNYFSAINNKMYDLLDFINTDYPGLNKIRIKPIINKNIKISKDIYNTIIDYIIDI